VLKVSALNTTISVPKKRFEFYGKMGQLEKESCTEI
jgi:hypothetical protein